MKILKKIFLKTLKVENLSEDDLRFLYKKFNKELRQYFIEQELPEYNIKQSDNQVMESLASLYESEDYKTLIRVLCNKKNSVARANLKKEPTTEYPDIYWKGFYRGQSFLISHILTLVRFIHKKYQEKNKEKGEK